MGRVRLGHPPGQVPPNTWADFRWAHEHEAALLAEFGERIVLIYQEQVIGVGDSIDEAAAVAESNLPPEITEITPITYFLSERQPFFRVHPTKAS